MTTKIGEHGIIKYANLNCETCGEKTSHVEVDTVEGKRFQCEICGTFWEAE